MPLMGTNVSLLVLILKHKCVYIDGISKPSVVLGFDELIKFSCFTLKGVVQNSTSAKKMMHMLKKRHLCCSCNGTCMI